jgi:tetratricopeptide (TPR) repeat protein
VLAAVGVALLWVARRRTGRAPLVAALFFAGTLAPALGFFNVYPMRFSYVADHFQYLASLGPIALAASGAWLGLGRLDRRVRPAGAVALLVVVSVLGARTWSQTQVYHDQETLWRDTLRKNPDAWLAHTNLAGVLRAQGRVDEAADHYREAIRLKPDLAYAHSKLGALLREQGRLDASLRHLEEALRLDPGSAEAHNSMALTLKSAGALDAATRQYREAVRLNPEAAPVHYNLGVVLEARGRLDEAIDAYRRALHLQPDLVDAHRKLGLLLLSRGAADRAIPHLRAWQRLSPGDGQARARLDAALRAAQGAGETGDPAAEVGPPAPD